MSDLLNIITITMDINFFTAYSIPQILYRLTPPMPCNPRHLVNEFITCTAAALLATAVGLPAIAGRLAAVHHIPVDPVADLDDIHHHGRLLGCVHLDVLVLEYLVVC